MSEDNYDMFDSDSENELNDTAPMKIITKKSKKDFLSAPTFDLNTIAESVESTCGTPSDVDTSRSDRHNKRGVIKSPDQLLVVSQERAEKYRLCKKPDGVIKELVKCVAYSRMVYGSDDWHYANSVCNLGQAYLNEKGWFLQAQYHCDQAKNILLSDLKCNFTTNSPEILKILLNVYLTLGQALMGLKNYGEADIALDKADKVVSKFSQLGNVTDDEVDQFNVRVYTAIAKLASKQKKHAKALNYFDKILTIIEESTGRETSEMISVYQYMGTIKLNNESSIDKEKGIEYYHKAHSICMSLYKDGSLESADSARKLATAYSCLGTEDAENSSESYLNECLLTYETNLGENNEKTIQVQDDLIKLMLRTNRKDEALTLLRKLNEAKAVVYGEFSDELSENYKLIGSILLSTGDEEKALKDLNKCYSIQCFSLGENSKKAKETKKTINILTSNPNLAAVQKKLSKNLDDRPNFNSIVSRSSPLGGFKTDNS